MPSPGAAKAFAAWEQTQQHRSTIAREETFSAGFDAALEILGSAMTAGLDRIRDTNRVPAIDWTDIDLVEAVIRTAVQVTREGQWELK